MPTEGLYGVRCYPRQAPKGGDISVLPRQMAHELFGGPGSALVMCMTIGNG
jgi:hypothetical protein